jgi:hypothetical protein
VSQRPVDHAVDRSQKLRTGQFGVVEKPSFSRLLVGGDFYISGMNGDCRAGKMSSLRFLVQIEPWAVMVTAIEMGNTRIKKRIRPAQRDGGPAERKGDRPHSVGRYQVRPTPRVFHPNPVAQFEPNINTD